MIEKKARLCGAARIRGATSMIRHRFAAAVLSIIAGLAGPPTFAADAPIRCTADLSRVSRDPVRIEIAAAGDGALEARINGKVTNARVVVVDDAVRSGLNLRTDPYSPEARKLNAGERSLVHLQSLLDSPQTLASVAFDPAAVKRVRTYDLVGKSDKFGGTVLLEAYGENGRLLGRLFRSIFVANCV